MVMLRLRRFGLGVGVAAMGFTLVSPVVARANQMGPDYVTSDNVSFIKRMPLAADGVGARVVGHYLYVTSTKDLEIYDITDPKNPALVGAVTVNVEFENEQVPTDGKILGISGQTPTVNGGGICPGNASTGCIALYDVRNPAAPTLIANVTNAGDHTSACVTVAGQTCAYMYGSGGHITDVRTALSNGQATLLPTKWTDAVVARGFTRPSSCHHVTEARPGILVTACEPVYILSVNAEDGGSIDNPAVLGAANYQQAPDDKNRFVHSAIWPNAGFDKILLTGGETNFQPTCGATNGAFSTFLTGGTASAPTFTYADEVRPVAGNITDGNPPQGTFHLGCSVHWFEQNPTFLDGGLVALASYENGTRFEQIGADGKITEVGFFEPIGGSTSAPHWAPDNRTVYAIDYQRGVDVIHWDGALTAPGTPIAESPAVPLLLFAAPLGVGAMALARRRRTARTQNKA
jgi:hypothetical protein